MELTAYLIGALGVTLLITDSRSESETLQLMTCVAPIDLRYSACLSEAVVMMGEKPESFVSWIDTGFTNRMG